MKKRINIVPVLLTGMMLFFACSEDDLGIPVEVQNPQMMTFVAQMPNESGVNASTETRTYLQDNHIYWEAGDKISVFPTPEDDSELKNYELKLVSGEGTAAGSFQGLCPKSIFGYRVVYPYDTTATVQNTVIRIKWNGKRQEAVLNSIPKNTPMVAYTAAPQGETTTVPLQFKNVCAFLKFTTDRTCKSVTLKAKKDNVVLASENYYFEENSADPDGATYDMYIIAESGSSTITLTGKDGADLAPGTYYIAMCPGTFRNGFDMIFEGENASTYTKSTNNDLKLVRNQVVNLGTINLRETALATLEGEGTEANPYLIKNFDDLRTMQTWVAYNKGLSSHYRQTADIEANGQKMNPIGNQYRLFSGTYDGDGHYINQLCYSGTVEYNSCTQSDHQRRASALFGAIKSATICNLTVKNPIFDPDNNPVNLTVSPLVGVSYCADASYAENRCKITNCRIEGNTTYNYHNASSSYQYYNFGGFVGDCQSNFEISRSTFALSYEQTNTGSKSGAMHIGGFIGLAHGVNTESSWRLETDGVVTIDRCRNDSPLFKFTESDNIHATYIKVGGFIGWAEDGECDDDVAILIVNSVNNADFFFHLRKTYQNEENYVGGFVGHNHSDGFSNQDPEILNCINNGNVEVVGTDFKADCYVAGFIACNLRLDYQYDTHLQFCVNTGEIMCDEGESNINHHFVGAIIAAWGTLNECWKTESDDKKLRISGYSADETNCGYKPLSEIVSYMNQKIQQFGDVYCRWKYVDDSNNTKLDLDF